MIEASSVLVGETMTITLYVYDADDALTDPDGYGDPEPTYPSVTIRKGETKYVDAVIDAADMATRTTLGTFVYKWQTAGCRPGPYMITCGSVVDGDIRMPQKTVYLRSPGT